MRSTSLGRCILLFALVGAMAGAAIAETAPAGRQEAEAGSPRAVVESLHEVLLSCMKGECGPDFAGRYEHIRTNLDETFDLPFMARMSIGKAWSKLSPDEQVAFVELSRSLSASTYADNFDSYGGQVFETLGEEPAGRGTILVKTELVQTNDDNVRFDYRLRKSDAGWRIIDVTLDGKVSEITMRRADYSAVIEREGYQKLVQAIEKKIEKHAKQ
jgi:phospholipid transport system substrate-binding protein